MSSSCTADSRRTRTESVIALRFDLEGKHSARRGDFRIVYEIDDDRRLVTVLAVDHRSDVYRATLIRPIARPED